MGMFDHIHFETVCPKCHKKADGFQSKDGDCVLDLISPLEVRCFYTSCQCGAWIEFYRKNNSKSWLRTLEIKGKHDRQFDKEFTKRRIKQGMPPPPSEGK